MTITLIDSYSEANQDSFNYVSGYVSWLQGVGQSFTAVVGTLDSAQFYLRKNNSPTGNAVAKIYNYTGTPGSTAKPTGAALATSDTFDVSTLTTSFQLIEFLFSGAERIGLSVTNYIVTIEYTGGDATNLIVVGRDDSSSTHAGNFSYIQTPNWTATTGDLIFYVYGETVSHFKRQFPLWL